MVVDFKQRKEQILRALPDLPPSNIEAEESILGGILLDPNAFARVKDILKSEHFYVESHRLLYKRICELSSIDSVTDFLSVKSYLEDKNDLDRVGGLNKLTQLLDRTVSAVNIDRYATLVVKKWLQRETQCLANNLYSFAQNYQDAHLSDWFDEKDFDQESVYNNLGLYLEVVEKQVHELTRSRYRESLSLDSETVRAKQLIDKIKDIENNCKDLVSKRFKKMNLAKQYKMSEKQLESLYLASLIGEQNEPIQTLASLREKYGDD
ncbi:DnaB-like helicase N-terminal domain-containing protein, partial [Cyanothece sp. BG0011]|uniref:DnaB-like helicase N-terminal domain-containing protein n=1 Tax=Cyanothece sp. BG0011 TaxID=2082950 RepID=UPI0027144C8E